MPIEWPKMRPFRIPLKREKFITEIIKWSLIVLIAAMCVKLDINEKILSFSIPLKGLLCMLIGTVLGVSLEVTGSYFKDFLIKRRMKREGFFVCKPCNGNGWTPKSSRHWFLRLHKRNHTHGRCNTCGGRGYVDWIQNVVGVKGYSNDNVGSGPTMPRGSSSSV
jgi:hypothetical protein